MENIKFKFVIKSFSDKIRESSLPEHFLQEQILLFDSNGGKIVLRNIWFGSPWNFKNLFIPSNSVLPSQKLLNEVCHKVFDSQQTIWPHHNDIKFQQFVSTRNDDENLEK